MLRQYQQDAILSLYKYVRVHADNPCIVMPTGTGKSHVIAQIASDAHELWGGRVIVLAHVKELLEQNAEKLRSIVSFPVGVYSAGLGRRDTDCPILVAGIQSVYQRANELGPFTLAIVDEAHLIPPDGDGMYRQFLRELVEMNPKTRLLGLTATPYRLSGGEICKPENLINKVCYEVRMREMIAQGYLAKLRGKASSKTPDMRAVHVRGGEYVAAEMEQCMDADPVVNAACEEIVTLTRDRKSVLIFTSGVMHCRHVVATIKSMGQKAAMIDGETASQERADTIAAFRTGKIKYLCNVNVLTTGFDAPGVDCVALLRATLSPGLYVQMVGRGTRTAPGKDDCLVLDYGGNIERHGPVDSPVPPGTRQGGIGPTCRICPACQEACPLTATICTSCKMAFPEPERGPTAHAGTAGSGSILSGEERDYDVKGVSYSVHEKRGADEGHPKTMKVEYKVGWNRYISEWVCPEHTGFARQKFLRWWKERTDAPAPVTARDCVDYCLDEGIAEPTAITVTTPPGDKYDRIIRYELSPKPESAQYVPVRMDYAEEDVPF